MMFLIAGFFQSRLRVSRLRVMQLDTEPAVTELLDVTTNKSHPFLMGSLRTSIWLGQYT